MAEPLAYQSQEPPAPNGRGWGFFGCVAGVALFGIALVERLTGAGSREVTALLLPYAWLLASAGLPFSLTIVLAVIQLPLEGGMIGLLIERHRPILASGVVAVHLAAAAVLHLA